MIRTSYGIFSREYRQGYPIITEEMEQCKECGEELKVEVRKYKVICSDKTTNHHSTRIVEECKHEKLLKKEKDD